MKLMNADLKLIQPVGILNSSLANQLCHDVDEIVKAGYRLILVDLQDITFIDSSGLGGLVNAFKSTRAAAGRLVLCSVGEQGRMLLEITGMDQVFEIYANQAEFEQTRLKTA